LEYFDEVSSSVSVFFFHMHCGWSHFTTEGHNPRFVYIDNVWISLGQAKIISGKWTTFECWFGVRSYFIVDMLL
jgi:hypothetical protein